MKRVVEVEIGGRPYTLNLSAKAFQILGEKYGGIKGVYHALLPGENGAADIFSSAVFDNVLSIGAELLKWGAAYRRFNDGDDAPAPSKEELEAVLHTEGYVLLYAAILQALSAGATRQIETEDDPKNADATQES